MKKLWIYVHNLCTTGAYSKQQKQNKKTEQIRK